MRATGNQRRPSRRTARLIVLMALAATAIATTGSGSASAIYFVRQCWIPNTSAPDARLVGNSGAIAADECAGGRRYGLTMEQHGFATYAGTFKQFEWDAPAYTVFKTAQLTHVHYGTDDGWGPLFDGEGVWTSLPCGGGSNVFCDQGMKAANAHWIAIVQYCWKGSGWCGSNWAYVYMDGQAQFEVEDQQDPSISAGGELLNGGIAHGVEDLSITASDLGGGVSGATVYVNGSPSESVDLCNESRDATGALIYLKPCPDNPGSRLFHVDTEHDPGWVNGANDVQICAADISGRSRCIQRTVQVDNSCPSSGGQQAASLDSGADVGGTLRRQATVRSTEEPVIRGSLKGPTGNPTSQATVCIYQTVQLADSSAELVRKVTTQDNGRFALRLDAGASRKIDVVYRYNNKTLGDAVQLDSSVLPTLKVARRHLANGGRVRFRGRLPGPNAGGRAVALQARVGRKWRTFKQLQTDATGAFRGLYRFLHTAGRQRYLFRAAVKRQAGYPYEPGSSRKREVIVRG